MTTATLKPQFCIFRTEGAVAAQLEIHIPSMLDKVVIR